VSDTLTAAHAGPAPVVVADRLGVTFANLLCGELPLGDTFTYLSVEGPAWIRTHLQVDPTPRDWAVGGLSCGGTCPLQLAVNAPPVYPTFLDFAGQDEPTLGDRASTVNAAVRGSAIVFAPVSPLDVVKGQRLPATAGVISAGRDDAEYGPLAAGSSLPAQRREMNIHQLPGEHTWAVWAAALERSVPFFWPAGAV